MEEFEFDLQCLQSTTVFDKQISHFSAHNESGEFKCNYQSPTYNSYQIKNPIFNIFCSPNYFRDNFNNENKCNHDNNENYKDKNKGIYNISNSHKTNLGTFVNENYFTTPTQLYHVTLNNEENNFYSAKESIINMLKSKCREFISEEYEIEIFI